MGGPIEQPVDRQDPQRRRARPQRERQDDARRSAPRPIRGGAQGGAGRRRHDGVRHRARGAEADDVAVARRGAVRVEGLRRRDLQDQPHRHARLRRLRRRRRRRPLGRRPGGPRRQRRRRRRGRHRVGVGPLRRRRHPADGVRQQGGQAAGRLPPHAGPAAGDVRLGLRAARAAARRGGVAARHRRRAHRAGLRVRARRPAPHRAAPRRHRRRGAPPARRARRGDRLRRRRAARALPRPATSRRRPSWSARWPTSCWISSSSPCCAARRSPVSASTASPTSSASSAPPPPTARRSVAAGNGDSGVTSTSAPTRPASRWPTCSRRSPTSSSARSRCSRCCRARSSSTSASSARRRGTEERMHGLFHLRGKDHLDHRPDRRRRHRRRRQAVGHPHRHDAGAEGLAGARPPPDRRRRPSSGSPSSRSPRPTTTSSRARCSGCSPRIRASSSIATRRPARRCCAAAATPTSRWRSSGWPASSASTSRPRTSACRTGRRSPARPRPRARSRSSPAVTASTPSPTCASSPKGRGEGTEFKNSIVGGTIPKQYIPAVQRGVEETMATGGVHGFPVVDVLVECYDGKFHSVDSSDMAFRSAAAQGLKEALAKAGSAVLEPISLLTVRVPDGHQGDVLGDLNSRRGRVSGTSSIGDGTHEIVALVPAAEIQRYAVELRSMTGGPGDVLGRPRPLRHPAEPPGVEDQDGRHQRRPLTAPEHAAGRHDRGNMPGVPTDATMLAPYRVLDLTDGRAELATAILAGLGADVVKVEPPGGAASRHEGQLVDGEPDGLASLRFHAFNRGKRSVVLDLDDRRRPPAVPRPRRHRRLRVRERRPGRDGRPRAGVHRAVRRPTRPRVRRAVTVRAGRPLRPPPRHRPDDRGDGRGDGAQRRARPPPGADHRAPDLVPRGGRERARRARRATTAGWPRATPSSSTCRCRPPCSGPGSTRWSPTPSRAATSSATGRCCS